VFKETLNHRKVDPDGSGDETSFLQQELLVVPFEDIGQTSEDRGLTGGDGTDFPQVPEQNDQRGCITPCAAPRFGSGFEEVGRLPFVKPFELEASFGQPLA
jgi:hypothetical protein